MSRVAPVSFFLNEPDDYKSGETSEKVCADAVFPGDVYRPRASKAFFSEPGESNLEITKRIMIELVLNLKDSCLALFLKKMLSPSWW